MLTIEQFNRKYCNNCFRPPISEKLRKFIKTIKISVYEAQEFIFCVYIYILYMHPPHTYTIYTEIPFHIIM